MISDNFKLTTQEKHGLQNEINDLRKILELTQNNLEKKVNSMEKRMEKLGTYIQEVYEYQIDSKYVQDKLTELEDRSCRDNARVGGIKERGMSAKEKVQGNYFLMTEVKSSLTSFDSNAFLFLHLNITSVKSSSKI